MRFGAIDVGTNSIHLVVVEVDESFDTSRVIHKEREMVRLGSDDALERGRLSRKAMERGVDAIAKFVLSAHAQGADRVRAVATSAVREAENGGVFRDLVEDRTGLRFEVLSGEEEARLIHLGVAAGFPLYDRTACIIDIGGGSTEFIVASGDRPYLVDSVKLGSLRLYDAYLRGARDPRGAARALDEYVSRVMAPVLERVRHYDLDLAIGTSGTIMGLAAVDAADRGIPIRRVHGYVLRRSRLEGLQRTLLSLTEAERRRLPGMNPRRADIIVAGNAILIGALALLGRDEITVCERALRDGVVVDLIRRDRALAQKLGNVRAARLASVEQLAHRYEQLGAHERQVARLAVALFDQLAPLHGLGQPERDALWAAATLHQIGRFVAESGRHKHTQYLIDATPLDGWRDEERALVGLVARYHRRALPKTSHLDLTALTADDRHRVEVLGALLRLADGLDIRHLGQIGDVLVRRQGDRYVLVAQADGDASDEVDAAMIKSDLFERAFGARIVVEAIEAVRP